MIRGWVNSQLFLFPSNEKNILSPNLTMFLLKGCHEIDKKTLYNNYSQ